MMQLQLSLPPNLEQIVHWEKELQHGHRIT